MQGKIALEEHFALDETLGDSKPFVPADHWDELRRRLEDYRAAGLDEVVLAGLYTPEETTRNANVALGRG